MLFGKTTGDDDLGVLGDYVAGTESFNNIEKFYNNDAVGGENNEDILCETLDTLNDSSLLKNLNKINTK